MIVARDPPGHPGAHVCEMRNLHNPVTQELDLNNVFVCTECFRTHLCDLNHGCQLIATPEGSVCAITGLSYESIYATTRIDVLEPTTESNIDEVNVVTIILSYVYAYLIRNSERYRDVLDEVAEDGKLTPQVESAVYFTFNKVFKQSNNLHKIPLSTIGQLFTQLIIGVHAKVTKYDATVIKVSRRKREDGLLKQMRFEYGNAPTCRVRS
ncbi:GP92 [Caviid betaherpesvirus 2]|uniref:GP92 n=2 Tax=Caviid betaherpesvirus 2 TaxID=33706 RepID=U6H9Y1_9BETA|nr:GP92 [Caviid betaherpesvirus 2]AGE11562.1 GP92 [Caviid betaherpesvirus 2]AIL83950.1 GP92 [BAC cloning vector GPN13BACdenovo_preserved(MM)]BAJ78550.1 GP92 [Caviid betaherpesvirus 2]CDI95427.1 GP92 [Caviid herpesvirus 2 str. CIDMTR]